MARPSTKEVNKILHRNKLRFAKEDGRRARGKLVTCRPRPGHRPTCALQSGEKECSDRRRCISHALMRNERKVAVARRRKRRLGR